MRKILVSLIIVFCLLSLTACDTQLSPDRRLSKLRSLVEDGKFEEAVKEVEILKPQLPTDSTYLMLAGKTYMALNQFDSAHVCFKQYTALYPTRLEGYHFLYQTGGELEDYDAQIWAVSQLGYLENDRKKYHYDIARLNFLRGEYGQAMRTCYMILEYNPSDPGTLFILANSLATAGMIDSAIVIMERLNRQSPDKVEVLSNLASFLVDKKDFEQAARHFGRITALYPDYMPGWFGLGNVLLTKGDTAGAREAYWQVYTRDSTFLDVDSILRELGPTKTK